MQLSVITGWVWNNCDLSLQSCCVGNACWFDDRAGIYFIEGGNRLAVFIYHHRIGKVEVYSRTRNGVRGYCKVKRCDLSITCCILLIGFSERPIKRRKVEILGKCECTGTIAYPTSSCWCSGSLRGKGNTIYLNICTQAVKVHHLAG